MYIRLHKVYDCLISNRQLILYTTNYYSAWVKPIGLTFESFTTIAIKNRFWDLKHRDKNIINRFAFYEKNWHSARGNNMFKELLIKICPAYGRCIRVASLPIVNNNLLYILSAPFFFFLYRDILIYKKMYTIQYRSLRFQQKRWAVL